MLSGAASIERIKVLEMMISDGGKGRRYSAKDISDTIKTSQKTAKRVMAEFTALGMVDLDELGNIGDPLVTIRLKENLWWVFDQQFKDLRGNYAPGNFKDYLVSKKSKEQKGGN